MTIKKVAVIGGGTMESGIAEVAAKSGCDTIVVEIDASLAEQAQKIRSKHRKSSVKRKMTDEDRSGLLAEYLSPQALMNLQIETL